MAFSLPHTEKFEKECPWVYLCYTKENSWSNPKGIPSQLSHSQS